ncbi:MAG: DUF1080 domain-containing protein [Planctomycetaceae bacterium]|jgi:hypothetical protein|nr:DUF1080 domain-containing protein [Planctomycetaceae bacterium]
MRRFLILLAVVFLAVSFLPAAEPKDEYAWQQLFDGKTLTGWSVPVFGGDGEVKVQDGNLVIGQGAMITGVKYDKVFPRVNYEIRYEAKRTMGNDFFAALTFPVNDGCCTFINGGWGGGTVGLSCVDGMDASENETSSFFSFTDNKWYKFRVFVTGTLIRVWIDEPTKDGKRKETLVIDLKVEEKKISLRDETSQYQPLGICTWVSEGRIRDLEYRKLKPEEVDGKTTEPKQKP